MVRCICNTIVAWNVTKEVPFSAYSDRSRHALRRRLDLVQRDTPPPRTSSLLLFFFHKGRFFTPLSADGDFRLRSGSQKLVLPRRARVVTKYYYYYFFFCSHRYLPSSTHRSITTRQLRSRHLGRSRSGTFFVLSVWLPDLKSRFLDGHINWATHGYYWWELKFIIMIFFLPSVRSVSLQVSCLPYFLSSDLCMSPTHEEAQECCYKHYFTSS